MCTLPRHLGINLEYSCLPCLTFVHNLNAVAMLHVPRKVDLQCSQPHVCSRSTSNGITCPSRHLVMWPDWLGINASSMCLDEFSPKFTAALLWSDYQRRLFHAERKVRPIGDVIVPASLRRGVGMLAGTERPYMGERLKGKNEGLARERLWVGVDLGWCQWGTPQLLKMTPDDLTHSQTLHITMSRQGARRAVRRRENGQKGRNWTS